MSRIAIGRILLTALALAAGPAAANTLRACPFCSATQQTLGEELTSTDAAILAQLIKAPPPYDPNKDNGASFRGLDPEANNATFRIVEKLRGSEHLLGIDTIEVPFFGQADQQKLFLITGIRTDRVDWTTPLPLSKTAEGYIKQLFDLPQQGPERLAFFQDYLENEDPMLAQDAYDEFARAPYDAVIGLKDNLHHDRLVEWIHDVEIAPSRRRLYLTMLGVCGDAQDAAMLEYYMSPTEAHYKVAADAALAAGLAISPAAFQPLLYEAAERYERLKKQGLDAMIACYLTLEGAEGLPLVEDLFLKDPNGDYKDIFSAIYALRFHGEETDAIPRARLLEAMRLVLDNPTFADQVIADLSRWEDWGAMDRLAEMFKAADKSSYVRQPIAAYMLIAAEQEGDVGTRATAHLADLREVDRQAIDDAERNMGFGLFAPAMPRSSDVASADASVASETTRTENAVPDVAAAQPPETGEAAASEPRESTQGGETTVALASEAQREAPVEASANAVADVSASEPESQPAETAVADTAASAAEADERAPDQESTSARQPTSPAESTEPINPPSRPLIFGATALAVAVLAGLFALLLRGFAR